MVRVKKVLAAAGVALIVGAAGLVLPVKSALAEEEINDALGGITPMSATNPTLKEIYDQANAARVAALSAVNYGVSILSDTIYMQEQLKNIGQVVVDESRKIQNPQHVSTRTQVERARVAAQKAFDQVEVNKDKLNAVQATEVIIEGKVNTAIARANAAVAQAEANRDKLNSAIAKVDAMRTKVDETQTLASDAKTAAQVAGTLAAQVKTMLEALDNSMESNFEMIEAQMAMGGNWTESAAASLEVMEGRLTDPACDDPSILMSLEAGGITDAWYCAPRRAEQLEQLRQTKEQTEEVRRAMQKSQELVDEAKKQLEAQEQIERATELVRQKLEQLRAQEQADADRQEEIFERIHERLEEIRDGQAEAPAPGPAMPGDATGVAPGAGKIGEWFAVGECLAPRAPVTGSLCGYGPELNFLGFKFKPLSYCGPTDAFGVMKPLIGAVLIIGAIWVSARWLLAGLGVTTPDQGA